MWRQHSAVKEGALSLSKQAFSAQDSKVRSSCKHDQLPFLTYKYLGAQTSNQMCVF